MQLETRYQAPPHGFRTFLIVWATQSVSAMGSALTFFAITIWLTQVLYPAPEQRPELALALSWVTLSFSLPTLFIGPIAGAWADRHDRKRTMVAMNLASGALSLALAVFVLTGQLQLWVLLFLTILDAIFGAFHGAAFDTSYAMIVPEEQLPRANGMMQTMWSLSGILSPAIAATLISLPALARQGFISGALGTWLGNMRDGAPVAMTIDAITFFLAAGVLPFLFIPSPKRVDVGGSGAPRKSIWADIREGASYIFQRPTLLWLLGTFTVANLVGSPLGVFMPLILKFNLAPDWLARGFTFETALALLSSIQSIGGVAGGLLISLWGGLKRRRVYGVLLALIASGIADAVLGQSPWLFLTAACGMVHAFMLPIMNSHSQTIWQTQTPRELQGRVFAVRRVIAQFTWPLGTALAGLVGGILNPGTVITILGITLAVFCIAQLFNPYMLRVEDKEWLDAMAARRMRSDFKAR